MSGELVTTSPSVARAADLARSGEFGEAEEVLRELGGRDSADPAVLDLLARIHAQRGELFDADECWALALRLDAGFAPARAGRRRIAALLARRLRPRTGRVLLAVAWVAVAVAGAGVAVGSRSAEPPGPDPVVLAELDEVQDDQRAQAERLDGIDDRLGQTALRQQRVLDDLLTALAGNPALTTGVESGAVVVAFPTGVFSAGVRFADDGGVALSDLARRLRPFAADVSITVVGHTEDAQVSGSTGYTTNAELGTARATLAAERMSEASGLPLTTFSLSSSGAANPPFSNATTEGRARNRTVTVVVSPR
ncbi:OmpA family protein [Saccharothrix xinjiangensis]|uniref:OmpA family protein n=1 Tax=Saccharothrix xinjiangensis TaxID=204798 RepID=A0ABV9XZG4_9PSEU